jgi:AraC-like DNA-binding protein
MALAWHGDAPNTLYLPTLLPAIEGLLQRGVAAQRVEAIFQRSLADLRAPLVRVPLLMSRRFWEMALESSGDPAIGLELGGSLLSRTPNGMSYLFDAEPSLKRGFEQLVRCLPAFLGHFRAELVYRADEVQLRLHDCGSLAATPQMLDYLLVGLCALVRRKLLAAGQGGWPLRRISLSRAADTDDGRHARALGAPVHWGQPWTALHFERDIFVRELTRRDDELRQLLLDLLAEIDVQSRPTLLEDVCDQIARELPNGPSLDDFCADHHLTGRTARRRLLAMGWRYSELLDEYRRYRASDLLQGSRMSLVEVTDLLGYGDLPSFSRAFARWYGSSPGAWRDCQLAR